MNTAVQTRRVRAGRPVVEDFQDSRFDELEDNRPTGATRALAFVVALPFVLIGIAAGVAIFFKS